MGIEPTTSAWKAEVLPLNYTRLMIKCTEQIMENDSMYYNLTISNRILGKWWLRTESNRRHMDFQSIALPTELLSQKAYVLAVAVRTGLEPATSCVTGRHSNQLNYRTSDCGSRI